MNASCRSDLRYDVALSPALFGRLTRQLPFFYVLGNHDGEARYGDSEGSYGHFEDTRALSRGARLRHLPDPTSVYPGSENGDLYFSFVSGDARFIILDVMAGPLDYPKVPEDWTRRMDRKGPTVRATTRMPSNPAPWRTARSGIG